MAKNKYDFTVDQLGPCKIKSPIQLSTVFGDACANYVRDDSFVRNRINVFSKDEECIWICRNCGHIVIGTNAPDVCPVCNHPQSYFEIHAENY